ncbi:hypothetical protein V1524DRAFT_426741 [Lipomyces starkeyi]
MDSSSTKPLVMDHDRPRGRVLVYVNGQKQGVIDAIYETPAQSTSLYGDGISSSCWLKY